MIAGRSKPSKVPPGHEICAQGDPADCIWLLHEGLSSDLSHVVVCHQQGQVTAACTFKAFITLHMAPLAYINIITPLA